MKEVQQADRQWLNYLYSASPETRFDYLLFQKYHRFQRWRLRQRGQPLREVQVQTICDRYGNVMWHAYHLMLKTSISTYSEQELQRWCRRQIPRRPSSA